MGKTSGKSRSPLKKVFVALLCILLAIVFTVGGYVSYVLISYKRVEDGLTLEIKNNNTAVAESGRTYTILTQNFGFGAYTSDFTFFMDGGKESRARSAESVFSCLDACVKTVKEYDPDFIFFQEIDLPSTRSCHTDQVTAFENAFPSYASVFALNYDSAYLFYPVLKPIGKSVSGILTFSKFGATGAVRRQLPVSDGFDKFLDLDRCYSVSRHPVSNGKELVLYNVHLSAYGTSDALRTAQMSMLFNDMQAEYAKGNYCVCGGDFNHDFTGDSTQKLNGVSTEASWAQPFPAELLPDGIKLLDDYDCGEQRPTCRDCDIPYEEGNFTVIVDGFLASENVNAVSLENVQKGFVYSDHNPVVLKFTLA